MAAQVVVLQHLDAEKPGRILHALRGMKVHIRNLIRLNSTSNHDIPSLAETDGLVVMGGPMSVNDSRHFSVLTLERDLLARAIALDVPTLGVCLGAQLIARAHNLSVLPGSMLGHQAEIGWSPIEVLDHRDPVVGPLAEAPEVLHWHNDRILPDANTRVVARTATTPCQAFRAGRSAWGL